MYNEIWEKEIVPLVPYSTFPRNITSSQHLFGEQFYMQETNHVFYVVYILYMHCSLFYAHYCRVFSNVPT
jgi:hypothetical protein